MTVLASSSLVGDFGSADRSFSIVACGSTGVTSRRYMFWCLCRSLSFGSFLRCFDFRWCDGPIRWCEWKDVARGFSVWEYMVKKIRSFITLIEEWLPIRKPWNLGIWSFHQNLLILLIYLSYSKEKRLLFHKSHYGWSYRKVLAYMPKDKTVSLGMGWSTTDNISSCSFFFEGVSVIEMHGRMILEL